MFRVCTLYGNERTTSVRASLPDPRVSAPAWAVSLIWPSCTVQKTPYRARHHESQIAVSDHVPTVAWHSTLDRTFRVAKVPMGSEPPAPPADLQNCPLLTGDTNPPSTEYHCHCRRNYQCAKLSSVPLLRSEILTVSACSSYLAQWTHK